MNKNDTIALREEEVKIKKNYILKNYRIWFLIMNSISFIGGLSDAFIWIPYGEQGGLGGFPVFSLLGMYIGCISGLVYSLINIRNTNLSKEVKISQIIISSCGLFIPILPLIGVALGWILGGALVKLF